MHGKGIFPLKPKGNRSSLYFLTHSHCWVSQESSRLPWKARESTDFPLSLYNKNWWKGTQGVEFPPRQISVDGCYTKNDLQLNWERMQDWTSHILQRNSIFLRDLLEDSFNGAWLFGGTCTPLKITYANVANIFRWQEASKYSILFCVMDIL